MVRKNEAILEIEIINYLSDKLAKFKQPKKIIFLDSLPRNAMGKVQKAELRKKIPKII